MSGTGSFGSSFNSPAQSEDDGSLVLLNDLQNSNHNLLIKITQNTHTFKDESYRAEGAFTVFLCSDDKVSISHLWKSPNEAGLASKLQIIYSIYPEDWDSAAKNTKHILET